MRKSNKKIVVFDPQVAGISGDMIIGALISAGANTKKVVTAMKAVQKFVKDCKSIEINIKDVDVKGYCAKRVEIATKEKVVTRTGDELRKAISVCTKNLKLSARATQFVLNTTNTLIAAETKVHGRKASNVHLHELGSVDTIIDIIGTAVALEDLHLFEDTAIYSTPVAVGGGLFEFSHGIISSPAPVTLEILRSKNVPMVGGSVTTELATPTGVAILVNYVQKFSHFYPAMKPFAIGYGAGTKNLPSIPDILRITIGESLEHVFTTEQIFVLETSLDDVSGEIIGHAVDRLLQEGAKDVSIIPMVTRKNRPGHIIKIITDSQNLEHMSRILMEETGTLGVRVHPCERFILSREIAEQVKTTAKKLFSER